LGDGERLFDGISDERPMRLVPTETDGYLAHLIYEIYESVGV
jgi:hypothetical protein